MAYLILGGGTLDLSGSGSDGTFDVPGVVDFADGAYGKVYLTGGVLANADVTQDTGIAVLGIDRGNSPRVYGHDPRGHAQRHDRSQ